MLDFYLHAYKQDKGTNAFNAPHKYRFALKKGMDTEHYLNAWERGKNEVLKLLYDKINGFIVEGEYFGFITPPSRTHLLSMTFVNISWKHFH